MPYGQPPYGQQAVPYGQPPYGYPGGGYPGSYPGGGYPAAGAGQNGLGLAGMITGIASLALFWIPFLGGFLGLVGAVLSGVSLPQSRARRQSSGFAVAGLICGIVGVVLGIAWLVLFVFANTYDPYYDY